MSSTNLRTNVFAYYLRYMLLGVLLSVQWFGFFGQNLIAGDEKTTQSYDLVIYGGTSAAVIAAVEAKRHGKSVVIVCPDKHLGGLSSGGLGWTDSGKKSTIGGLAREFYHRVWKHYESEDAWKWQSKSEYGNRGQGSPAIDGDAKTMWIFEPHVAEKIFEDLVRENDIPVYRDLWLDRESGVKRSGSRIQSIQMLSGEVFGGRYFMDATYEGDLLASAKVEYHVGRESNETYGETWNGVQVGVLHHSHFFSKPISAYQVSGDPSSGVLPRISRANPGQKGEGDHRIQAYCYRMCLTNKPENRVAFPKPKGYDREQYDLLARTIDAGWNAFFHKFDPIPNRKTDTNNHGPFSTDNIGMNYDYPDGTYERRQQILDEHRTYQQGLMYFLANDSSVPVDVRKKIQQWGLAKDEFVDNGHWPHQIYVREARRMVGEYVMTENDCLDKKVTPRPVGMGSYTLDSHNVQRYIKPDGTVQNEGDIGVKVPRPYEISYGSLIPKKDDCTNLVVPVCVSSSHIAFGSIRMEPVFMILAHSAAAATVLAMENESDVQDVKYDQLQSLLSKEGQVLTNEQLQAELMKGYEGTVVDDSSAKLTGKWNHSHANKPFVSTGYRFVKPEDTKDARATFSTALKKGRYELRVAFPPNKNRSSDVLCVIETGSEKRSVRINQRKPLEKGALWSSLGEFACEQNASVTFGGEATNGYVVVDAVQWIPIP